MNADEIRHKRIWNKFCNGVPIIEIAFTVNKPEKYVLKVITNILEKENQMVRAKGSPENPELDIIYDTVRIVSPFVLITNDPEIRQLAKKLNII